MKLKLIFLSVLFLMISCASPEVKKEEETVPADPQLILKVEGETRTFSRSQLLQMKELRTLVVEKDVTYSNQQKTYSAIPVAVLFKGMKTEGSSTLLFSCLDGFSAPISASRILNQDPKGSMAYIAIQKPDEKWGAVKGDSEQTAGPFYLVWDHPEKSKIVTEEWPYQLAGFESKPSIEKQFPKTAPDQKLSEKSPIKKGYQIFMRNCFACHTVNGEGASKMGPDLNIPFNPTEYLGKKFITKLVRNPQSLRRWPQAKMPPFDVSSLPDEDLQKIILYLQHMAQRKVLPTQSN